MSRIIFDHFRKADPILYSIIGTLDFPKSERGKDLFADICEIIIQQQLSGRVGDVIFARFKRLFSKEKINPQSLMKFSDKKIRKIGTSNMKVKYLKNLAKIIAGNQIQLEKLIDLENEEIINRLIKIKGIGRWSAEMFLIFSLGREDIFSYGDLGLRKAIQKLYKLKKEPTQKQAEKIANKWKPYRTYACRILWRSLD